MAKVFTHGRWLVTPGREADFVEAWTDLARRAGELRGSERPTLLRDRERQNLFLTFGGWSDIEAVESFRASDLFQGAVTRLQPMLESFEPATLDEVDWT